MVGAIAARTVFMRRSGSSPGANMNNGRSANLHLQRTETAMQLPSEDEWLKDGLLEKRIVSSGVYWNKKKIVLTRHMLAIAQPGSTVCLDHIPLEDIESVTIVEGGASPVTHNTNHPGKKIPNLFSSRHGSGTTSHPGLQRESSYELSHRGSDSETPQHHRQRKRTTGSSSHHEAAPRRPSQTGDALGLGAFHANFIQGQMPVLEQDIQQCSFEIATKADGNNRGRGYCLRGGYEECKGWIDSINSARVLPPDECGTLHTPENLHTQAAVAVSDDIAIRTFQSKLSDWYHSHLVQGCVCTVILLNFALSIIAAQMTPAEGTEVFVALDRLDWVFTIVFVIELLINMLGHWFWAFWTDGWNVFDFVVVVFSVFAIALDTLPGFKVLRLMRVFRVVRLFRFLSSLRIIINALSAAIIPVANAFAVLVLVTMVYSVMGVNLFRLSAPHQFGDFFTSLFTMFQVLTADGWATTVVRPLFDVETPATVGFFFVSYILIVGTFLVNVVIAVLLDEFVGAVSEDKRQQQEETMARVQEQHERHAGALDPLLSTLTGFNTSRDLSQRVREIFGVIDEDEDGFVSLNDLKEGLGKLAMKTRVYLSQEDFDLFTEGGELTDEEGRLDILNFETMIRAQLAAYIQRGVALALGEEYEHGPEMHTVRGWVWSLGFGVQGLVVTV